MTATVSTKKMLCNTRTIDMARYPLPERGLRPIAMRCFLAALISVVSLVGSHQARAQPTEAQILELLKKKHLMRCPNSPSETGCGETSTSPFENRRVRRLFRS